MNTALNAEWGETMNDKILLMGSEGSMGKRYQAILNYLEVPFDCYDIGLHQEHGTEYDHYIIATPTDTHYEILKSLKDSKSKILCEKPITKDMPELEEILSWGLNLTMMMQYQELKGRGIPNGSAQDQIISFYDYFRTGPDNLPWDAMQVIALHEGEVKDVLVSNELPYWCVQINNEILNLAKMDLAYIVFVNKWIQSDFMTKEFILNAHKKVHQYKEYHDQSHNRHSGQKHI
jgi:hypothetical protein